MLDCATYLVTRKDLEALWHLRVNEAKDQLDLARRFRKQLEGELKEGRNMPDGDLQYRQALAQENVALEKYAHAVKVFTEILIHGRPQAGNKDGSE